MDYFLVKKNPTVSTVLVKMIAILATGLKIMEGQLITSIMSSKNGNLTGKKLHSLVMFTGHGHPYSRKNNQILTCKS